MNSTNQSLDDIGLQYLPSKIQHNYLPLMDFHFSPLRESAKKILEIGVQTDRSVKMFEDYFPNATIYGLDIDSKCKQYEVDRVKIIIGDQTDINILSQLPDDIDVIIDDGSHIENDVIASLNYLFKNKLKIGGLYVIEDMMMSPYRNRNLFEIIFKFNEGINYWPQNYKGPWSQLNHYEDNLDFKIKYVTGLHMYRNLTIIDKNRNPEDVWAKKRIDIPDLCKNNELTCYNKELNNWSHLDDKSQESNYGANICYGGSSKNKTQLETIYKGLL
tara:strand:- start:1159 stop:1977 length:819 start_codon:yes stop_codon:yes gene_type:complete